MKKNVIMILVDDLRPEINCFGKHKLSTPNIDKLAQESIRFENNYCQTPLCVATRASMFSGILNIGEKYLFLNDMRKNNEVTLPGIFKQNGYESISIGKSYHFNHEDDESWTKRYQHTFYEENKVCDGYCSGLQLEENKLLVENMAKTFLGEQGLQKPPISECADVDEAEYPDFKTVSYAIDELSILKQDETPFFMTVGLYRPHLPWAVPKKYWDLYKREDIELAANNFFPENAVGKTNMTDFLHYGDAVINNTYDDLDMFDNDDFPTLDVDKQRECVHGYWASVSFMDHQVGRLINAIKAMNLQKDTVIIFAADNGWHLGEHKLWSKVSMFEESTRVPLMICVDGITQGTKTTNISQLLDIYPTICDLCGFDAPAHLDGKSLVPIIENDIAVHDAVFSRIEDAYTVRYKHYRFTYFSQASVQGDAWHIKTAHNCELFDFSEDQSENINIYPNQKDSALVQTCKSLLEDTYNISIELK